MSKQRIQALSTEIKGIKSAIDKINDRAAAEGRDLDDHEQADVDKLFDRAQLLKPELEKLEERHNSLTAVQEIVGRLAGHETADRAENGKRERIAAKPVSAGEYFAEYFDAFGAGGHRDLQRFLDRAAPQLDRALAEQATSDNAGVLPEPIIGELVKLADSRRPVFAALTSRPMPRSSKTFTRPRITQRVNVAEQDGEFDEPATRKMTIVGDSVTKQTFAGALRLSQQDIDWTDPAILNIVLTDFVDYYAEVTEGEACDFLEGLPILADIAVDDSGHSPYTTTNAGTIVSSFTTGAVDVYTKCKRMPTHIFLDLASAATLAGTTTGDYNRTVMAMVREALNELEINPTFVVGPQLAANTRILAAGSLLESYEQRNGLLQAVKPEAIATDIAYYGYVAFWGRHEAVIALGDPPAD